MPRGVPAHCPSSECYLVTAEYVRTSDASAVAEEKTRCQTSDDAAALAGFSGTVMMAPETAGVGPQVWD